MKGMRKFPSTTLTHEDGWAYEISSDGEEIKVKYFEDYKGKMKHIKRCDFTIPLCLAELLGTEIAKLAIQSDKL